MPIRAVRAALAVLVALVLALGVALPAGAAINAWTRVGFNGDMVGAFAIAPLNPNLMLAVAAPNDFTYEPALYRSTDGGRTWDVVQIAPGPAYVPDLQFDPSNPDVAYALLGPDFYKSTDGGLTWTRKLQGDVKYWDNIAISTQNPSVIFLAGGFGSAVMRSTDQGETWEAIKGFEWTCCNRVAISPTNPRLVLVWANSFSISRSTNGGNSWRQITIPVPVNSLAFNSSGSVLYGLSWDRVLRSFDQGETWSTASELAGGSSLLPNPRDPAELFVLSTTWGASPSGAKAATTSMYRSTDGGSSFSQLGRTLLGIEGRGLATDQADPQTLYVTTRDGLWAFTLAK